jgi:hypothetical protein
MGIAQATTTTRLVVMTSPRDTILKATLSREPTHPHALPTLLEAISLWEGAKVHAALGVGEMQGGFASNLFRDRFGACGEPLYAIDVVPMASRSRARRRDVRGLGDFRDLRQMVLAEAWR